ncbi:MAG TPA: hypothetical protein V6C58_14135 [Allocoleopsis sp.]
MPTCKKHQLYNPLTGKCNNLGSKQGVELDSKIKICEKFPDISEDCVVINKYYITKLRRIERGVKKVIKPLVYVTIYNILVFSLLLSNKVREKLIKFLIRSHPSTQNLSPVLVPLVDILPTILSFVNKYHDLANVVLGNVSMETVAGATYTALTQYESIKNTTKRIFGMRESLKKQLVEEIPGKWKKSSSVKTDPRVEAISDFVEKKIDSTDKISNSKDYISFAAEILPGTFYSEI